MKNHVINSIGIMKFHVWGSGVQVCMWIYIYIYIYRILPNAWLLPRRNMGGSAINIHWQQIGIRYCELYIYMLLSKPPFARPWLFWWWELHVRPILRKWTPRTPKVKVWFRWFSFPNGSLFAGEPAMFFVFSGCSCCFSHQWLVK